MVRMLSTIVCGLSILGASLAAGAPPQAGLSSAKFARGHQGMAATGSPYATRASTRILEAGGNAVDAAAAALLALMVTDPANASLAGRAQMLLRLADGRIVAIDGATQAPAEIPPLAAGEDRRGYEAVPVPGGLAALAEMVDRYGQLDLPAVLQPSIALAEEGFEVPPRLAASWARFAEALGRDPGAARTFLKPDGSPYQTGEVFRQPRLAGVLRQIAASGIDAFYRGPIADAMARDIARHGGFVRRRDLQEYRPRAGVVVRATYRGYQVAAAGGRAWGDTLVEMLNILDHFSMRSPAPDARQLETLARVIAVALDDRPQELGTLKPKPNGYALATLSSPEFAARRAQAIRRRMMGAEAVPAVDLRGGEGDTSHLSVMDADGNAVALTTSIGPSFGSRVATPELGFLFAHSYRMRAEPSPGSRDETEMTPTIVLTEDRPVLAIGAAGSERIPTAILQVISHVIDRGRALEQAVTAPRILCIGERLEVQAGFSTDLIRALREGPFEVEELERGSTRHLGLVQAVQYDPATREYFGAADPAADGSAAGPQTVR